MNKSETISKLADALSKAQAEMPVVKMNKTNPFLKNAYADLGAVIETSRPILAKNGLSISQFPTSEGDKLGITSILMHASGEWIESTIIINPTDSKGLSYAQATGVVISYLRRYAWASILGLYADEDTDGHVTTPKKVEPTESKQKPNEIITASEWDKFAELINTAKEAGVPNVPAYERAKMTASTLNGATKYLLQQIEKVGK